MYQKPRPATLKKIDPKCLTGNKFMVLADKEEEDMGRSPSDHPDMNGIEIGTGS